MSVANAEQCLAILSRHARDEVGPLRLQELCTDTERVNSLVEVHNRSPGAVERYECSTAHLHRLHQQSQQSGGGTSSTGISGSSDTGGTAATPAKRYRSTTAIQAGESPFYPSVGSIDTSDHSNRLLLVDLSRNRMTVDTVNHLLRLARARDVRGFIRTLAWGWNDRFDPVVPLRSRKGIGTSGGGPGSNPSDLRREGSTMSGAARHARFAEDVKEGGGRGGTDNKINGIASASFADQSRGGGRSGSGGVSSSPMRTSPSMHIALRAPAGAGMEMYLPDGTNALDGIHETWDRIMRLSDSIRRGSFVVLPERF